MIIIKDKKECVGCFACYNRCPKKCITMEEDQEGFNYPKVNLDECVNCGLCEEVCPVLRLPAKKQVRAVYACINKNEDVRMHSSSGGCFSLLAEEILKKNGIVFGAAFDDKFEVHHISIDNINDLAELRGSKYVQSRIEDTFKEVKKYLMNNKVVLFSGTPCQIAGLRRFIGKEYDNLFLVDVVCHGVPSPKVYRKLLHEAKETMGEEITSVNFRDKSTGWKTCSFIIKGTQKEFRATKQDSNYMKAFLKNMSVRPSCSVCRYNNEHSSADLTIADYWGVETKFPELNDDKGVTIVLINTKKGSMMFKEISENAVVLESDFKHGAEHNFAITKISEAHPHRTEFFKSLGEKPLENLVKDLL